MKYTILLYLCFLLLPASIQAQWTNRYPKVAGYGHHVYMEAFELPVLNVGPHDPAPSPVDNEVVFSARGWLWIRSGETGIARRLTSSSGIDSRPNWSPDGQQIVFVRDDGSDTQLMLYDLGTGESRVLVDTEAIDLDPLFSADGRAVYYSSAVNGSFNLFRIDPVSGVVEELTNDMSLERLPVPSVREDFILYLQKQGFSYDNIARKNLETGEVTYLVSDNFASQAAFTLAPDNRTIAYTWPHEDDYELRLTDIERPDISLLLTKSDGLPLVPKFSADGKWIYFAEMNKEERSEIKRVRVEGGPTERLEISSWEWGEPTTTLKISTSMNNVQIPVRLSVTDKNGHPVVPESSIVRSEGQHGTVFFYSPGTIDVEVPRGKVTVSAVHGFSTVATIREIEAVSSDTSVNIALKQIWDANKDGWYSGDNHFHLNYGGRNQLDPEDILTDIRAEGLDVAYPLLANLHNRYLEKELWGWKHESDPIVTFGQEVRSHFLGHLNLIGTNELFWPWIWGPGYDVYGRDDRPNAGALAFARKQGGMAGYVHPVSIREPFSGNNAARIPVELIADCVLGEADMIELGCLWTDEIGTAEVWHKLLNIGIPLAISAGSDVMCDYYRTMAIGSTRVYVHPEGDLSEKSYLDALKQGRSFVTNGPQLTFTVSDKQAGEVLIPDKSKAKWVINVYSPVTYETVEIFVNGEVVWSDSRGGEAGIREYKGNISLPGGGWITARVSGGESVWPMMDSYPFAETAPVWIGEVGSVEPEVAKAAASDLLNALTLSEMRLQAAYEGTEIPQLSEQFERAREKLNSITQQQN